VAIASTQTSDLFKKGKTKPVQEMVFLNISLTKDSILLLHSQSLLLADFKENHPLLWLLKSVQKIRETNKL
jgi:hypothetical protein